jgi:hypothetical protein
MCVVQIINYESRNKFLPTNLRSADKRRRQNMDELQNTSYAAGHSFCLEVK